MPATLMATVGRGALVWAATVVGLRAVVLQPEHCGDADTVAVSSAAEAAVGWFVANQRDDGTWLYRYDRAADADLGGYSPVRHAGVVMSLEQAASAGIPGAGESAAAGLEWALANLYEGPGFLALAPPGGSVRVGATALLVAALVERRERTGDDRHDGALRDLAAFLEAMVTERGQVLGEWSPEQGAPVPASWNQFFTGEVFWALALLHRAFPSADYDVKARRVADYLATERDDVEGWWPDVADHWAAYGFAAMVDWPGATLEPRHIRYARRQMGFQSLQIRWESQRTNTWFSHYTRGRQTLGAGMGTIGEALDQWALVAGAVPQLAGELDALTDRARCAAGVLVTRQSHAPADPAEDGAWFQFDVTQMDDQQHSLSALLGALRLAGPPGAGPS